MTASHPPRGRPFEKGNPGKKIGAKPISERRARKMLESAIVAEVAGAHVGDFSGDALGYLQAVYKGERMGDPLRLSAASQALKFERPSLSATVVKEISSTPTTAGGIESAIEDLVLRGFTHGLIVDARATTGGAGEPVDAGQGTTAEVAPGEGGV